jgi:hypothetical protein
MTKGTLLLLQSGAPATKKIDLHLPKRVKPSKLKSVVSIPKIKQVAKLAEGMGKKITALTLDKDGGFTITVADLEADYELNPFDEVLK